MKKLWLFVVTSILALAMSFTLVACGGNENNDDGAGGDADVADVVGDYSVDLSALGMPLTVYLRISKDGTFKFSSATDFVADKNSGTVSKISTGYVMIYSTINNESASGKTTNFTKESDGSLKFDGTVYYGSTKPSSPMENEDTGEMHYLYAVPVTEDEGPTDTVTLETGLYYGTHESTGMQGATVIYRYYLDLREDGKFTSLVSFDMMGTTYYGYDYGTYSMMGAMCRMTSEVYQDFDDESKPLTESMQAMSETEIVAELRVGPMATKTADVTMEKAEAPTSAILKYEGVCTIQMGGAMSLDFDLTLDIYADGSYTYTATTVMMGETNEYTETGYIGLNTTNSTLYILPDDVTSGLEGSIDENGSISAKFSVGQGAPQDVVLTPVAE